MGAGILHTIVFHRALGLVRPKDVDLELFEITYVSDSVFLPLIGCSWLDVFSFSYFLSAQGSVK